ncbi:hypothetical protein BKA67DRAFT_531334 [Truncatella angustata]|uniref:Uncharacterized protein n=1 Tax=Truncatella angustata TaxID=152316 RepID=A0A9P8V0K0_9PEZI|nr:uncharacterized protein BKA67DRAFT_531334 [Truncatella angustata]KAH6661274.1 hypothetical protein BKA67DRAFT_531334 [Truncatella angustata]
MRSLAPPNPLMYMALGSFTSLTEGQCLLMNATNTNDTLVPVSMVAWHSFAAGLGLSRGGQVGADLALEHVDVGGLLDSPFLGEDALNPYLQRHVVFCSGHALEVVDGGGEVAELCELAS